VAFTYDTSTDNGKVRLLVFDTNSNSYVFEDEELAVFLSIEGSSLKRAAALALETMASNEAFVLKVIQLMDLRTDGAATANAEIYWVFSSRVWRPRRSARRRLRRLVSLGFS
jgi:hypothetical protein